MTLTEILVAVTIMAILAGVVTTGVAGFVSQSVESSRAQLFAAVQNAVDGYVHASLPPSADFSQAPYPIADPAGPFGYGATMTFASAAAPAAGAAADESVSRGWYGADGKLLLPQPGFDTNNNPTTGHDVFIRVDLYGGGPACQSVPGAAAGSYGAAPMSVRATDLVCLGYLKLPANAPRSPGVPGTSGQVIRCLFVSNTDVTVTKGANGNPVVRPVTDLGSGVLAQRGGTTEAEARAAVRSTRGKVLACRDADPSGAGGG